MSKRKLFRTIVAIPCFIVFQSIGTLAFTLLGLIPVVGILGGIGNYIKYLGTGNKEYLEDSKFDFSMLVTLFGGSLVCYSWIQTGDFDFDNIGLTHLDK